MRIVVNQNLKFKLEEIKLIALDFDGVLTDNKAIHREDGMESVCRSKLDSMGVDILNDEGLYSKNQYKSIKHEIDIVILSREINLVVQSVAKKMKIKCQQAVYDKLKALEKEVKLRKIKMKNVLFMGNDVNDIPCMKAAGVGIAVQDALRSVKLAADFVTFRKGGDGAFREVVEMLIYVKRLKGRF